jgi:hypothetical protein
MTIPITIASQADDDITEVPSVIKPPRIRLPRVATETPTSTTSDSTIPSIATGDNLRRLTIAGAVGMEPTKNVNVDGSWSSDTTFSRDRVKALPHSDITFNAVIDTEKHDTSTMPSTLSTLMSDVSHVTSTLSLTTRIMSQSLRSNSATTSQLMTRVFADALSLVRSKSEEGRNVTADIAHTGSKQMTVAVERSTKAMYDIIPTADTALRPLRVVIAVAEQTLNAVREAQSFIAQVGQNVTHNFASMGAIAGRETNQALSLVRSKSEEVRNVTADIAHTVSKQMTVAVDRGTNAIAGLIPTTVTAMKPVRVLIAGVERGREQAIGGLQKSQTIVAQIAVNATDDVTSMSELSQLTTDHLFAFVRMRSEETRDASAKRVNTTMNDMSEMFTTSAESFIALIDRGASTIEDQGSAVVIAINSIASVASTTVNDVSTTALQTLSDTSTLISRETESAILVATSVISSLGTDGVSIAHKGIDGLVALMPSKQSLRSFMSQKTTQHASAPVLPPKQQYRTHITAEDDHLIIATLHMSIFDSLGLPLSKTPVVLFSDPKIAVTDEEGTATFHDVPVGKHTLEVHVTGKEVESRSIVIEPPSGITAEEQKQIDVVLPVIQVMVSSSTHGAAPATTNAMYLWSIIGLLTASNVGWMTTLWYRRRRKLVA